MEKEILNEKLLTVTEVSKILRVNRNIITRLIITHKLKAFKVEKKYLIPMNAIKILLENNEVK